MKNLPLDSVALGLGGILAVVAGLLSIDGGGSADPTQAIKVGVTALAFIAFSREWRVRRDG